MTRTERSYYLIFGLYSASWSFIGPMYALFLLSRGLDLLQINLVLATYLITAFLFEVPTGAVADRFGRKVSFVLSCATRTVAFALYARSDTFAAFLLAEAVDALGTTLATGALDAWAVDGIRAEGNHKPVDRMFARANILARVLMIGSGLAAGYIADWSLTTPWVIGAAGFVVTGTTAALLMRDAGAPAQPTSPGLSYSIVLTEGLRIVHTSPVLRLLCLLSFATAFAIMPVHQLWQPRMRDLAAEGVWVMGWIWALLNLTCLMGSALLPRLLFRFGRTAILSCTALWRAATLAVAALATGFMPALGGLLLQEVGFGVSEPTMQAWMNEHVAAERRATVLSVRAMAFTLGGAIGLATLGLLARSAGIPAAWLISAAVLACSAAGYLLLGRAGPASAGNP